MSLQQEEQQLFVYTFFITSRVWVPLGVSLGRRLTEKRGFRVFFSFSQFLLCCYTWLKRRWSFDASETLPPPPPQWLHCSCSPVYARPTDFIRNNYKELEDHLFQFLWLSQNEIESYKIKGSYQSTFHNVSFWTIHWAEIWATFGLFSIS